MEFLYIVLYKIYVQNRFNTLLAENWIITKRIRLIISKQSLCISKRYNIYLIKYLLNKYSIRLDVIFL